VIRKKQGRISGERRRRLKRGIYLLPNLFTTGAMFAGFFAMIAAMDGRLTPPGGGGLVAHGR
jgi:CDP-diacylglycerol---serine O-phosphatidyltransferase